MSIRFRINLKHNYPLIVLAAAFATTVYFSFKHEPAPELDASAREPVSTAASDSIQFSALHPDPGTAATPPYPAGPASAQASARDLAQAKAVDEILATRNDNDPRLDTELRQLSTAGKALLRARYATLLNEKRNERGTLVFLVGRELSTADDVRFLHQVLTEAPCLSLADCSREDTASVSPAERHWEGPNETTLAYPQIVALKQIEAFLRSPSRPADLEAQALNALEAAKSSPIRKVASLAAEISAHRGQR